jgi:hypothetical protein
MIAVGDLSTLDWDLAGAKEIHERRGNDIGVVTAMSASMTAGSDVAAIEAHIQGLEETLDSIG